MLGKSVLIVEDTSDTRELLRHWLDQAGYRVSVAQDGVTGFGFLTLQRPDVILIDIMMPDVTGLELIRWIRNSPAFDGTPIIAMSAYGEAYLQQAMEAGATAVIHKPEGLDQLVKTIDRVLAGPKAA